MRVFFYIPQWAIDMQIQLMNYAGAFAVTFVMPDAPSHLRKRKGIISKTKDTLAHVLSQPLQCTCHMQIRGKKQNNWSKLSRTCGVVVRSYANSCARTAWPKCQSSKRQQKNQWRLCGQLSFVSAHCASYESGGGLWKSVFTSVDVKSIILDSGCTSSDLECLLIVISDRKRMTPRVLTI